MVKSFQRTVLPEQRRLRLLQVVNDRGIVSVRELSRLCRVSELTIRRDLDYLASKNLLHRTRGGAVALRVEHGNEQGNGTLREAVRSYQAITDRVDALILTPSSPKAARLIRDRALQSGVPIVAEAQPIEGAVALVTLDNFLAGVELGRWTGTYAREHLGGVARVLVVTASFENTEARTRGFVRGLTETLPTAEIVASVNGYGLYNASHEIAADALATHPETNIIFGINDASTLAALDAYRATGLDERRLLAVTFGLEGHAGKDLLVQDSPCKAGVAMFPEVVGRACIDAAVCAYNGVGLPSHIVTPSVVVTRETLGRYYTPKGRDWIIDLDAVEGLWRPGSGWEILRSYQPERLPRSVGFVYAFSTHEWYQNVLRAMEQRARELGVDLVTEDATETMRLELEELRRVVGRAAARHVHDGESIILDGGSTLTYMAAELRERRNLTVITNDGRILNALGDASGVTLLATGGIYDARNQRFVGSIAEAALQGLRADKAFISASGVSARFGLSANSADEAAVKRAMIRAAKEVILVVDHTKIGEEFLVHIAPLSAVHKLVTDAGLSARDHLELNQLGIQVILADE